MNKKAPNQFDILSPDGIPISMTETWGSKEAAQQALTKWMEQYEAQGYYSSNAGRIPLDELESRCTIQPIKNT